MTLLLCAKLEENQALQSKIAHQEQMTQQMMMSVLNTRQAPNQANIGTPFITLPVPTNRPSLSHAMTP
jgi:hypothetical protein